MVSLREKNSGTVDRTVSEFVWNCDLNTAALHKPLFIKLKKHDHTCYSRSKQSRNLQDSRNELLTMWELLPNWAAFSTIHYITCSILELTRCNVENVACYGNFTLIPKLCHMFRNNSCDKNKTVKEKNGTAPFIIFKNIISGKWRSQEMGFECLVNHAGCKYQESVGLFQISSMIRYSLYLLAFCCSLSFASCLSCSLEGCCSAVFVIGLFLLLLLRLLLLLFVCVCVCVCVCVFCCCFGGGVPST